VGELELDECSKASITFNAQVLEDCGNHGCALIAGNIINHNKHPYAGATE
jgi:hypothetical protein